MGAPSGVGIGMTLELGPELPGLPVEPELPSELDPSMPVIFADLTRLRFAFRRLESSEIVSEDKGTLTTCVPLHAVNSEVLLLED